MYWQGKPGPTWSTASGRAVRERVPTSRYQVWCIPESWVEGMKPVVTSEGKDIANAARSKGVGGGIALRGPYPAPRPRVANPCGMLSTHPRFHQSKVLFGCLFVYVEQSHPDHRSENSCIPNISLLQYFFSPSSSQTPKPDEQV